MGCAPSGPQESAQNLDERFAAPPPLAVNIGNENPSIRSAINGRFHETSCENFKNRIVAQTDELCDIPGGPGSQKGLVIEELIHRFGFVSINVEDIIFSYLPSKLANTVETTAEIQKMLKNDTGTLSVDWIFSMISAKLGTSPHQRFVVDIVPTLSSISRADSFVDSNHERCLENFERRYPVMFALELDVCDEVALLDRNGNVSKDHKDSNKKGSQNNQYGKDIDTADRGKLEPIN
ncbi:hypothetical protein NECAME_04301 [Necator americanus]|uniref:Uncharacterized protein n=1 Tax=Necator americanus TaxID=51031 RepID=W2SUX4_NECAM|nr:hypothetical protein NECAME_04301 [Necator americanus]ETN73303.1 hypothetical protein NECAME_04301 [Necator americanus]